MFSLFVSVNAVSIMRVSLPVGWLRSLIFCFHRDAAGMYRMFFFPKPKLLRRYYIEFPAFMTASMNSVYWGENLDLIKVGAQSGTSSFSQ